MENLLPKNPFPKKIVLKLIETMWEVVTHNFNGPSENILAKRC